MERLVYKVLARADWLEAKRVGRYTGSPDDARDGFIHLSTGDQLEGTLARHFAGLPDLVLVGFDAARLAEGLRWEPSRDGRLFPHVYGVLDPMLAVSEFNLDVGPDGSHRLPEGLK